MDKRIANIAWKPLFAAFMTGILSSNGMNPLLVGTLFGIAAAVSCYFEIKKLIANTTDKPKNE